ncbi:MAG: outer membrane protein assembly factor BamD [Rickettsiaceae bacterium]|nr:outer membrane protein assembly factor BamD [Rickettsiaceae bacterium]
MTKILKIFLLLTLISACKSFHTNDEEQIFPAEELYSKGLKLIKDNKYKEAYEQFGKIYFQHPGHKLTPDAEIMEAYSAYKAKLYDDAIDVLENFMLIHPANKHLSYAYYLNGLCYYEQVLDSNHSSEYAEKAKQALTALIDRFPKTAYTKEAKQKIELIDNHVAKKEVEIGKYYQTNQNIIGAINRYQVVIIHYGKTNVVSEALYRIAECYDMIGLKSNSSHYKKILIEKYPASKWAIALTKNKGIKWD